MFNRRQFLSVAGLGVGAMWVSPHMALASVETDQRFVFIIQRGAADGLDLVRPYGDANFDNLRGGLIGSGGESLKLDGHFALHPSLSNMTNMYNQNQVLLVHAVASPYRDRSHFDGQNVLESGGSQPYSKDNGWLNRLVGLLPCDMSGAIAIAPTIPLALQGSSSVSSFAPSSLPDAADDLLNRVGLLYERDPELGGIWEALRDAEELSRRVGPKQDPAGLGRLAAQFLLRDPGPRIAMIETEGWDTHVAQSRRLKKQLTALDTMVGALQDGLGDTWSTTTVLIATEFGRTAASNGSGGTDHGTAAVAFLLGGAVKGGRVLADWPGLRKSDLYEGRDLKPTLALDELIASVAADIFKLDHEKTFLHLFGTQKAKFRPLEGLIRS